MAGRHLRVLMLTAFPAIGGPLPKLAPLVADGLRRCGCEVREEGWSAHTASHEPLLAKLGGRTRDLVRARREMRAWRPDVVYVATAHNWPGLARDVPLAFSSTQGPPLVFHLHGSESQRLAGSGGRLFKAASLALARSAAAVMLLSREEAGEWRRFCPGARFEVVLNPFVPASPAVPEPPAHPRHGAPTLICVARLIPSKGVFDLLDAFAMLRRRRECRLLIAGTGPAAEALARRTELMGLDDSVRLLGYVSGAALESAYRAADAFVLPSYFAEGFPLSVMEAMGHGLPVVTTAIRGCADELVEGVNAVFVPPRAPEVLAAALERLLADDDLRESMGRANRAKVAEFAPDRVLPRYAEILRSAAGWDAPRGAAP